MKSFVSRIVLALVVGAMASVLAVGGNKRDTVTFPDDVKVNGTLVKSGTYEILFNEKTNELEIRKGSKVVAKTMARLEKRDGKARDTQVRTASGSGGVDLISVTFSGSDQNVVVSAASAQSQ
jgi:hypothetical protein